MGDEILVKAINFHKSGNLDKAKSCYTQYLKDNPKNIQALIVSLLFWKVFQFILQEQNVY